MWVFAFLLCFISVYYISLDFDICCKISLCGILGLKDYNTGLREKTCEMCEIFPHHNVCILFSFMHPDLPIS